MSKSRKEKITVFDLNDKLFEEKKEGVSDFDKKEAKKYYEKSKKAKKKIEEKELKLQSLKEENRKLASKQGGLTRRIKSLPEYSFEKRVLLDQEQQDLNKKREEVRIDTINVKRYIEEKKSEQIDDKEYADWLLKKPNSTYIVKDGFNKDYKIKLKEAYSDKDIAKNILKKYIAAMNKSLKKGVYKSGKKVKESTKEKIQFLIDNAKYNLDMVEKGYSEDEIEEDGEYYALQVKFNVRFIDINF